MAMSSDQQRIELLIHLFHGPFKADENLTDAQLPDTIPSFFMNWLVSHFELLPKEQLATEAGVSLDAWDWFGMMASGAVPVESLVGVWPAVTTSRRPLPQHVVESAAVVLLVRFTDGRIFPMTTICHRAAMTPGEVPRDCDLAYFLTDRCRDSIDEVRKTSIDQMYERGSEFGDNQNFEQFMGLLLTLINTQVQPQLRPTMLNYVRLFQGVFAPKLSDADRHRIAALKARQAGIVAGGFDLS